MGKCYISKKREFIAIFALFFSHALPPENWPYISEKAVEYFVPKIKGTRHNENGFSEWFIATKQSSGSMWNNQKHISRENRRAATPPTHVDNRSTETLNILKKFRLRIIYYKRFQIDNVPNETKNGNVGIRSQPYQNVTSSFSRLRTFLDERIYLIKSLFALLPSKWWHSMRVHVSHRLK